MAIMVLITFAATYAIVGLAIGVALWLESGPPPIMKRWLQVVTLWPLILYRAWRGTL